VVLVHLLQFQVALQQGLEFYLLETITLLVAEVEAEAAYLPALVV
jgi:hypothetical protein